MRTKLWLLVAVMLFVNLTGARADVVLNPFSNEQLAWGPWGGRVSKNNIELIERYWGDARPTGIIMEQVTSDLPNGTYDVVVYAHACHANGVGGDFVASTNTLSVNGSSQTVTTINNSVVADLPMTEYTFTNVAVTDGTMGIRLTATEEGANWFTIRVKSVTLKGSFTNYALTNAGFAALTGWTNPNNYFALHADNPDFSGNFAEMWRGNADTMPAGSLSQNVTLPAGIYMLSAKVRARGGITSYLYASYGGNEQRHAYVGDNGVSIRPLVFVVNTPSTVTVGIKHDGSTVTGQDKWIAVDDFTVTRLGDLRETTFITSQLPNPSFENNGLSCWTVSDMWTQDNRSYEGVQGRIYTECWHSVGEKNVHQALTGLPAGRYNLKVTAQAGGGKGVKLYAGSQEATVTDNGDYDVDFFCDGFPIEIGYGGTGTSTSYLCVDNFRLKFLSPYATPTTFNFSANIGQWYAITIGSAEQYTILTSGTTTLYYTQTGTNGCPDLSTLSNSNVTTSVNLNLSVGTLYVFSTAAVTLSVSYTNTTNVDVTEYFLVNADFGQSTPTTTSIFGYAADATTAGVDTKYFQYVDGWTIEGSGADGSGAGVFSYGSSCQLRGNNVTPPAAGPSGTNGKCLGLFAVWSSSGYYYQDVTLPGGTYKLRAQVYNASGTQAMNACYIGFKNGDTWTVAPTTAPTVGSWTTLESGELVLTQQTTVRVCVGYKSNGNGAGSNPMLFFDKIQIVSSRWLRDNTLVTNMPKNTSWTYYAGEKGTYTITCRNYNNNTARTIYYATTTKTDNLTTGSRTGTFTCPGTNSGYSSYNITVDQPGFIRILFANDVNKNVKIALTTNNEAELGSAVAALDANLASHVTQCNAGNFASLVSSGDKVFVLVDAKNPLTNLYTMQIVNGKSTDRPAYGAINNPLAIVGQVWRIESDGYGAYSFKTYRNGRYFQTGTAGWDTSTGSEPSWYIANVMNRNFHLRSVSAGGNGNYVGPWSDSGGVDITADPGDGYNNVAGNKSFAKAPGFLLFAIDRSTYDTYRMYSESLKAAGWKVVSQPSELGKNKYEYILLDANENGVETGYIVEGGTTGRPHYKAHESGNDPSSLRKWWMAPYGENGGYSLQNVDNDYFLSVGTDGGDEVGYNSGFTNNLADATVKDFLFTPVEGQWTLSSSLATAKFGGRWANKVQDPLQNENIAFNKAKDAGKRRFIIMSRPTGNLGVVDYDEQGWEEVSELPANLDNYFFAYYSKATTGLGLMLSNVQPRYASDLDPNTDKAGVWTLTSDTVRVNNVLTTNVVNTNITNPRYFLQTNLDRPYDYVINNNGGWNVDWAPLGGNTSWGRIIPQYQSALGGWYIVNGRLSYTAAEEGADWADQTVVDYGKADSYPYYLGPWTPADPKPGQQMAFNKTNLERDLFQIFSITRGKYVKQNIGTRAGTHDISYVITNPHGTQFSYRATHPVPLGWKQLDAAGEATTEAFWVQNNNMFQNRGAGDDLYIEAWDTKALTNRTIYQEYSDMPDGYYTLTVNTNLYDPDGSTGAYLFLNGEQVDLGTADEHGLVSITTRISSGTLKFGAKIRNCNASWVCLDNFTLSFAATQDVSTEYFANPSFELKNDANGYLMGWTLTDSSSGHSAVQSITGADGLTTGVMTGVDEDKFFYTSYETVGSKTLGIKTTSILKVPAGSYRLSTRIATHDGDNVYMKVFAGDAAAGTTAEGNRLNTVVYTADTDDAEGAAGENTGIRTSILFTLDSEKYITVYYYQTKTGTAFFKLDNLRLIFGGHTLNIADYLLPNPSFEYADADHNPANPEVIYSTMLAINELGTDVSNSGIYGWDISEMNMTGATAEQRVAIGADYALNYYSFVGEDNYTKIPTPAHGEKYFYNGQYRRNTGGNQTYKMSTSTMSTVPAGTYIANIKYKAVTSYAVPDGNDQSPYDGSWPLADGQSANLTFAVKNGGGTTLATVNTGEFKLINREHGGGTVYNPPVGWVDGRDGRRDYIDGSWQKLSLIWVIEEPTILTFELTEQLRQCYAVDVLIDDLRLIMMNVPETPEHYSTSITSGTEYYLMNAATGQFLMGDNQAGTHAALVPHGMPFKAEQVSAGVFTFDSKVYLNQPEGRHYLHNNGADNNVWVDNLATNFNVTHVGDGLFTIKYDGSKYLTPTASSGNRIDVGLTAADANLLSRWYLISKADRESNLLLANAEDKDATFYIPNASFSVHMNTEYNTNRWTLPVRTEGGYNFNDGTNVAEAYHKPFHTWKTVSVPNGTYKLRCQGFYRNDGSDTQHLPEFYAGEESVTLPERVYGEGNMTAAASSFVEGRYYTDYVTVNVTNNLLTLGLRLDVNPELWVIWDNIEMELVSQKSPATGTYSDITSAISTMTAHQGFEGEQWAPYVLTRCDSIVRNGVIDQGFPKSFDKVDDYFLGLANTEFANAFYRGDFAEYRNYDLLAADGRGPATGWTTTGTIPDNLGIVGLQATEPAYGNTTNTGLGNVTSKKALYVASGSTATYGETVGYKMPLIAGVTYTLSFKYGGWGGTSTITLTGKDGDGTTALTFTPDATTAALGWAKATSTNSGSSALAVNAGANAWKTFTATITPVHDGNCTLTFTGATANSVITDLELHPRSMDVAADTYYIYNVGAAKYLTSGDANGISAIFTEYGGLDMGVASYHSGLSFDTGIYASNESHYLGNVYSNVYDNVSGAVQSRLRCDTIQSVWYASDAGTVNGVQRYYLYNAAHKYLRNNAGVVALVDKPSFPAADDFKWVMKTYADRVQEMKDLTADGHTTIDATFLMPAADFKYRDSRWGSWHVALDRIFTGEHIDPATFGEANYERTDGVLWENGTTNTYTTLGSGGVQVRVGGYNENYVFEAWEHGIDMYQELTTKDGVYLPHGVYTLSAQCADSYTNFPSSYLYIGDVDNDVRYDRKHNAYAYDSTLVDYHDLTGHAFLEVDKNLEWDRSLSKYFLDQGDNFRKSVTSFVFGDSDDDTHDNPATFRVGIRQNNYGFHGAANAADGAQWLVFDNFRLTYRPFYDGSSNATDLANDSETLYHEMEEDYLTNVDKVEPYNDAPFCVPANDPAYVLLTGTYMSNLKKLTSSNTDEQLRDTYLGVRRQAPNYVEDAVVNNPSGADPRFTIISKATGYWINDDGNAPIPHAIDWTNNAMSIRGAYGATGNAVTMAYDVPSARIATSPYPQAFTFTPAAGKNCFTLSYTDYTGTTRYLCRGTEIGNGDTEHNNAQIRTTTTAGDALIFRVIPQTTGDGIWYLKNTNVGTEDKTSALVHLLGNEKNHDIYTGNKNYALSLVPASKLELSATVKEGYDYSTIVLPYDAVLPSSITAWTVTKISDGTDEENDGPAGTIVLSQMPYITSTETTQLRACTPYLICAPEGGTPAETSQTYSNWGVAYTGHDGGYGYYSDYNTSTGTYGEADIFFEGALEGSQTLGYGLVVPMSSTDEYYNTYLLTKRGEVKFYRYNSSATTAYCQANKAFLRVKKSVVGSTKDEIVFPDHFWDLDDAIDETTGEPVRITGIYNTAGVKIPVLQKGLNIVVKSDGSTVKVMVK